MKVNHLGLPVCDVQRSRHFYETYFGFDPSTAQEYPDGTVIVRNTEGFDLALHLVDEVGPSPDFLHFGFRSSAPDKVRAMLARLDAGGMEITERYDQAAYVAFKVLDPDGHRVEVYWEAP